MGTLGEIGDGVSWDAGQAYSIDYWNGDIYALSHQNYRHHCFIRDNGQVYCWGSNNQKQVANTTTDIYNTPTVVSNFP